MAVSQVSREWRAIALATPALWNIARVLYRQDNVPGRLRVLELFVKRSANYPLHVRLDLGAEDPNKDGDTESEDADSSDDGNSMIIDPRAQTDIVFPLVARWCSLEIFDIHPFAILHSLTCLRYLTAPNLRSIMVQRHICDLADGEPLSLFQGGAPALTNAIIMGMSCHFPLSSLTSLVFGTLPLYEHDFRQLVEASSSRNLLELRYNASAVLGGLIPIPTHFGYTQEFPHLLKLTFSLDFFIPAEQLQAVFRWFNTPALVVLHFACRGKSRAAEALAASMLDPDLELGRPSYPSLTTLILDGANVTHIDVVHIIIFGTPALLRVALIDCYSVANIFRVLLGHRSLDLPNDSQSLPRWPHLRTLWLSHIDAMNVHYLCSLVRTRAAGGTAINLKISPQVGNAIPDDELVSLKQEMNVQVREIGVSTLLYKIKSPTNYIALSEDRDSDTISDILEDN